LAQAIFAQAILCKLLVFSFSIPLPFSMALAGELDASKTTGSLSAVSKGLPDELIRDYEPVPGVKWRFGLPDYTRVNKAYFAGRTKAHPEGSLEAVVQKLVKNWEVESHHIKDPAQWKTMDVSKFKISVNGGCPIDANTMAEDGPYNMLLGKIQGYDASQHTFESANKIFSEVFSEGFAFEVLEVYSGPPNVAFRWRHFGRFAGQFEDDKGIIHKGDGRMIEIFCMTVAKVNEEMQIEDLQVFYDPNSQIQPLMNISKL